MYVSPGEVAAGPGKAVSMYGTSTGLVEAPFSSKNSGFAIGNWFVGVRA